MKDKALFISDSTFVQAKISGGVQICTQEFLEYLELSNIDIHTLCVERRKDIFTRAKVKLGIELLALYNFRQIAASASEILAKQPVKFIFLNQVSLVPIIPFLRQYIDENVRIICLSHGNESGDYLHDISYKKKPTIIQRWRLGSLITAESYFFREHLDGLVVISGQEAIINSWLGGKSILYLPRILKPNFITSVSRGNRAGFVGTLDHLPNKQGILLVAEELEKLEFQGVIRLVGGPVSTGEDIAKRYKFIEYCGVLNDISLSQEASSWRIFLNPVFWLSRGSSTKLKQAISWGLPCLSTQSGVRGYDLSNNAGIIDNDSPRLFGKMLCEILNDQTSLLSLQNASRENAKSFDVLYHAERLTNFLNELTS